MANDKRRVGDAVQAALESAFQEAAIKASNSPTVCSRVLVTAFQDSLPNVSIVTFGSASFTGEDPNDVASGDVVAVAPISVALPRAAALNLVGVLVKALGGEAAIVEDSQMLMTRVAIG